MTNRFNILGFSVPSSKWRPTKTCPIHHAVLVPKRKEKQGDVDIVGNDTWEQGLFCPICGSCYTEKEAGIEEHYISMHGPQQTKIIIGNKQNKKYYDSQGTEINDPGLNPRNRTWSTCYRLSSTITWSSSRNTI